MLKQNLAHYILPPRCIEHEEKKRKGKKSLNTKFRHQLHEFFKLRTLNIELKLVMNYYITSKLLFPKHKP
jgi:hypothetical protein